MCSTQVVVNLILDMKHYGHPSFQNVAEEEVRTRAAVLPQDGVPPEVLKVIGELDDAQEKLQPQKAATPCDGMEPNFQTAGKNFAAQRPRTALAQGRADHDTNQEALAALDSMLGDMGQDDAPAVAEAARTLEVRTGNKLVDQFQPCYFAIAFCFCFKYATAWPDNAHFAKKTVEDEPLRRRATDAPKVGIHYWCAGMQRRIEAQFRRDWTFGFTLWNYLFRTMVNLQSNSYMYAKPDADSGGLKMMPAEEITKGALEVRRNLRNGLYLDINGGYRAVNGDLSKIHHVPGLSAAAKKVLMNLEARTRSIPGTQEVRKAMRHEVHGNRVVHGTSAFVTFSPSERDTALMLKMVRARQDDPAIANDLNQRCYQRDMPHLDVDYMQLAPESLLEDCKLKINSWSRKIHCK